MAYQFSDLKSELKTSVGDPNLDNTLAGNALNFAQQEIFNKFEITLNSSYQSNTVAQGANTLTTALPSDLQRITALYITNSGEARDLTDYFLANKEFRLSFPAVTVTNPLQWWTFFTSIEFSTLADKAYTLRIEYVKSISYMSADADVPVIPEAYKEMLMIGAKIRVYEDKEDFDYANQFYQRYADLQEHFIQRYATRQVDNQFIIPGSRTNTRSRIG